MKSTFKIIWMLFICFTILSIINVVNAASASISADKTNVEIGETINVNVNVSAASWDLKVSGDVSDKYADVTNDGENTNFNKTLSFTPSTAGTYTFSLSGDVTDGDTNATTKISDSCTITVNAANSNQSEEETQQTEQSSGTQSTGALASITVNGKVYNNPSQDITVTVENEVEKAEISAESIDGSSVSGTGETSLKVGTNTVTLTVNGTNYYIRIRRLESLEDEKPNVIEDEVEEKETKEKLVLKTLKIEGYELAPKFSEDVFSYTLKIDMDKKDTEKLNITAVANDENAKVEITGNEKLKEGENIVNIVLTSEDGKETVTYQIKVNKILTSSEIVGKTTKTEETKEEPIFTPMQRNVIVVLTLITFVLGIIFAVIEYRYTKNYNDDYEEEYENNYNTPFYIKEDEEGRIDVVGENEEEENNNLTEEQEKKAEEENGYQYDEEEFEEIKRKKSKGKHF